MGKKTVCRIVDKEQCSYCLNPTEDQYTLIERHACWRTTKIAVSGLTVIEIEFAGVTGWLQRHQVETFAVVVDRKGIPNCQQLIRGVQ